jgi:hypothetical protein
MLFSDFCKQILTYGVLLTRARFQFSSVVFIAMWLMGKEKEKGVVTSMDFDQFISVCRRRIGLEPHFSS